MEGINQPKNGKEWNRLGIEGRKRLGIEGREKVERSG